MGLAKRLFEGNCTAFVVVAECKSYCGRLKMLFCSLTMLRFLNRAIFRNGRHRNS